MAEKWTVQYRGPAPLASALAQMLREEGVAVAYEAPYEERGAQQIVETVVLSLVCSGAYDGIKLGLARFRKSRFGRVAEVEVEGEDEGEGGDQRS